MLANIMPIKFTKKSMKEPLIICQFSLAMPIPVTASGGIIETVIATPGKVSDNCGLTKANVAAKPAIIAITTYIKFGCARDVISKPLTLFSCVENNKAAKLEAVMLSTTALISVQKLREITFISDIIKPKESERTGFNSGAINMLPTMIATLSRSKPKVAVRTDRIVIKKKSWLGVLPDIKRSTAFVLSVFVRLLNKVIAMYFIVSDFNLRVK